MFRLALTHRDSLGAFAQVRGSPFDSDRPDRMHRSCFGTKRPFDLAKVHGSPTGATASGRPRDGLPFPAGFVVSRYMVPAQLFGAYEKVKANKGVPGVDAVSIEEF